MITLLQIENFALIEHMRLELDRGMTVLTGETGSGKSIVLEALAFLFGSRAKMDMVREGTKRAVVEAEIVIEDCSPAWEWLRTGGYRDEEHSNQIVLRRELNVAGRSRAQINGRLATVAEIAELGTLLLEVHAQGEEHDLLTAEAQRDICDELAGCTPMRREVATAYDELTGSLKRREELRASRREAEAKLDYLRYAVDELEGTGIVAGELANLQAVRTRLGHADTIRNGCANAAELLSSESGNSASKSITRAFREIERLGAVDPSLNVVAAQLAEGVALVEDVALALLRHIESVETDPGRIEEIDDRLEVVGKVLRKHGPTETDALAKLAMLRGDLNTIEGRGEESSRLDAEILAQRDALARACARLSAQRRSHSAGFCEAMELALRELAMPDATVAVDCIAACDGLELSDGVFATRSGTEKIAIRFSANPGEAPMPLRHIASGGELSRLILAMKTLSANASGLPILVFDEVDAGLSGVAASRVGRALAGLGQGRQVLCVTHQASVAAFAGSHIAVTKRESSGRTMVAIEVLSSPDREKELARLLDGGADSLNGRRLAQELLSRAAS